MNKNRLLIARTITTTMVVGILAFASEQRSPVYLYTQCARTGNCTVKDSLRRYTPVEKGTPGAMPILGNIGNLDGLGTCDTLYVLIDE